MADCQIAAAANVAGQVKDLISSAAPRSSLCRMRHRDPGVACALRLVALNSTLQSQSQTQSQSQNGVALLLSNKENANGILYSEVFTIRCYEVGINRRASIQAIANLLQEVACNQVRTLGFSTDGFATTLSMRKHHLIWVTIRMHIEMLEYPLWGDAVELQTWFQESKSGTRRDWVVRNANTGAIIGRATSTWVMMNQETRRVARVNEEVRTEYLQYALEPARFAFPEDHLTYQKQHLARLETPLYHITNLKPRRADLDMNQHVNNVAYIGWMLESLPASLEKSHELRSVILEFRRECGHDDSVESMAAPVCVEQGDEEQYMHVLMLEGTNKEINRGWTHWVKIEP